MPKKKNNEESHHKSDPNVMGLRAEVQEQPICRTLEENYMPYAMSVIVSRAIPEIDGFKPSHRKLLYTMYQMGLLTKPRTKSANIVGQTMKLNPHGDAAIYDTMVRLARGNETLLHPFVDSKGNFGKVYSRDMACAASRYTEAKLEPICQELFRDIDADTVDFVDNYDATMQEPTLLPTTFPNVLVNPNMGIAVGMASNICSFNLREVCQTAIALIKDPGADLLELLPAPDFPTGGEILYDAAQMLQIYNSGRGSFRIRARWRYVREGNLIEIYEIPYTTATEIIIDKVAELIKAGKIREIADMRDETDLNGLKLAIDLKRGVTRRSSCRSSSSPPRSRTASAATSTSSSRASRACWACVRSSRSGRHGARTASAAGSISNCKRRRTSCICSRVSAKSCSTSTRPSPSSARPNLTQRSSQT